MQGEIFGRCPLSRSKNAPGTGTSVPMPGAPVFVKGWGWLLFDLVLPDAQGAGGAGLGALEAVHALPDGVAGLELGADHRVEPTAHHAQQALAHHLVAEADALAAEDALALVPLDGHQALLLVAGVDLPFAVALEPLDPLRLKLIEVGAADELTFGKVMAAAVQAAGRLCPGLGLGKPRLISWKSCLRSSAGRVGILARGSLM